MVNGFIAALGAIGFLFLGIACGDGNPTPQGDPSDRRTPEAESGWDNPLQPFITWRLKSLNGDPTIEGTYITLTIYEDSTGGGDGCNGYGIQDHPQESFVPHSTRPDGSYMKGSFSAGEIIATAALCDWIEGTMEQSGAYYDALHKGESFLIEGNRMEILDGTGHKLSWSS